jgi:hypothetical protein
MPQLYARSWWRTGLLRRTGRLEQLAGVRLVTLGDGIGRGVRVLEFRSGAGLSFDVLVDRAFDIGRFEHHGRSLTWLSNTGVVGPWYAEQMGLGWFRSWGGGMLVTCGLDHTLLGGVDDASQFHQRHVKPTEEYGLHGRVGSLPATLVGYGERWEGDECVLWAEGRVNQAAVFGESLELHRRVEVRLGDLAVHVRDEVTNVGFSRTTHMYLYHVNAGFPLVDAGARLLLPAGPGVPAGPYDEVDYRHVVDPIPDEMEKCWEHDMATEPDGRVPCGIVNRSLGLGLYQVYRRDQFPFHTTWRMLGEGAYGVALEPTTNRDAGRFDARERGELIWLAPGESRRYELELGVLPDVQAIDRFEARMRAITPPDQHPR